MTLCFSVRPSVRAVPSEKGCYILRFLSTYDCLRCCFGVALWCEDSYMTLLALSTILIGLAGMGFVVMDYL